MATASDLRCIALSLEGTIEAPHFDRAAFKVIRNYVTLAGDGLTANFKFTPDECDDPEVRHTSQRTPNELLDLNHTRRINVLVSLEIPKFACRVC